MISIGVNNNRSMDIFQDKVTKSIKVITGEGNNIDENFNISEGDFIMLINYYRYIKDNNIQCDFINYHGENEK